jgi:hypothetical protein
MPPHSMRGQFFPTRTFRPQLLFPPLTINNFQRHPCHEVVVITLYFGPEKAALRLRLFAAICIVPIASQENFTKARMCRS